MKKLMESWRGYEKEVISEIRPGAARSPRVEKHTDLSTLLVSTQDDIEKMREENPLGAIAGELALAFTPAGVAVDVNDLTLALRTGDGLGVALAGIGFIPVGGDAIKIIGRGLRRALKVGAKLPAGAADDVMAAASEAVDAARKKLVDDDNLHIADELANWGRKKGSAFDKRLTSKMKEWDAAGRVGDPPSFDNLDTFEVQTRAAIDAAGEATETAAEKTAREAAEVADEAAFRSEDFITEPFPELTTKQAVGTGIAVGTGVGLLGVGMAGKGKEDEQINLDSAENQADIKANLPGDEVADAKRQELERLGLEETKKIVKEEVIKYFKNREG